MRVIPVLDVMNGVVVRGVAGRRDEYRPIVSTITSSTAPLQVARAFREHFGLAEIYVADLDAIQGGQPALGLIEALHADGFRLWVDAGITTAEDARRLARAGVALVVAGLETVAGPETLRELVQAHGPERILFSLDLKGGMPLGEQAAWGTSKPEEIGAQACVAGLRNFLVLDLSRVGMGQGAGTEALCGRLKRLSPHVFVAAGGGVRGPDDLDLLRAAGADAVLIASALHDGRLTKRDVETVGNFEVSDSNTTGMGYLRGSKP
jgi:phosphoribosylformimino-5-aminoimidazole carboxamide ribotide isomerase